MENKIFVAIVGAAGRMGVELLENASPLGDISITDALVRPGSDVVGTSLGPDAVHASSDFETAIDNATVVIDFSTPESCLRAAAIAAKTGTPFVSGTTGLTAEQVDELHGYSSDIAMLWASNFSVGVNSLERLVELASRAVGEDFDIEIMEAHHRHKVDAPSGTARFLGEAAARGRGQTLEDHACYARHGQVGPRAPAEIGFQTIRGGDIVGEHTVFLCADGERLELTHRATDRGIFARGALRAAKWISTQPAGWYSMQDVLFGKS
ncbi:4-hydroxy-tetrahydrodipicolinate reductase [Bradymonas sediminis]|uniref:4-hydroxy-tetrahydrodipicolinate reductase n=1 Tax=Bradymonas sediminis TaxID=1548548 RepID=A0A2Z4FLF6_9DELT|nr:4-hydroxy-tetrahydrodipicolinate reductase [Bradymonas sediminis]AWV89635.1 4-hydroxy-tetrahydrodipicolinate reductase [Bradymonas sediminis]TDP76625.1 dihydrodipicolinate reductase [Bradymonas sediminis]